MQPTPSPTVLPLIRFPEYHTCIWQETLREVRGQRDRQAEQLDRLGAEVQRLRALLGLAQVGA